MDWNDVSQVERLKVAALDIAVQLYKDRTVHPGEGHENTPAKAVLAAAGKFFEFLYSDAPIKHITLVPGTITKQSGDDFARSSNPEQGVTMQLHDDEQVDFTVDATDAKGAAVTGEQIAFSVDDTSVLTLTVSADGSTATVAAGTVGSGVLTATVGDLAPVTAAIDVIAGDATAISLVEGTPTKQPTA